MRACFLQITSWVGTSAINAKHFYGILVYEKTEFELTHTLSAKEAKELNEEDDSPGIYKEGGSTARFEDRDKLILLAIETYKTKFPDAKILYLGKAYLCEPQLVLDGPEDIKEKFNAWAKRAEEIGWFDGGYEAEMDRICSEWRKCCNEN